jgi:cystathionine gamma-synthase
MVKKNTPAKIKKPAAKKAAAKKPAARKTAPAKKAPPREAGWGTSTLVVHGGEERKKFADSVTTPIVQTSTYVFHDEKDIKEYTSGQNYRYEYLRYGNPTVDVVQNKIALLEGAEASLVFASGMAAITTTLFAMLKAGDHVIYTSDIYKKTLQFIQNDMGKFGVQSTMAPPTAEAIAAAIMPNTTLIFTESPTNPYVHVIDLEKLMKPAKKAGIPVIIDNTFATPYNCRPLEYGADLVIHSLTKYIAGHNDVMGGVISGSAERVNKVKVMLKSMGANMDPHAAYLIIRGLKTFALRMKHMNQSALTIAQWLEKHPRVKQVWHSHLPSHPSYKIAKKQMPNGIGSCFAFEVDGSLRQVQKFLRSLKVILMGPSLGGTESLITHPATITYYDMTRAQRYALNVTDQLCRLAVGVEDPEDLIADLDQALKGI